MHEKNASVIHKILRKLFKPFRQIKQRVSPFRFVVLFYFYFLISAGSCDGRTSTVLLILSLLVNRGCNAGITASCGTDVGDVGEDELEELADRPGTTNGTWFAVLHSIFLPFLMRCGF